MTTTDFQIVPAEWPEKTSLSKKALTDFLDSGLEVAEIKGDKEFLNNVRRAARSNETIGNQIELRMQDQRLYIRRKNGDGSSTNS